jgi:hypothetical protein
MRRVEKRGAKSGHAQEAVMRHTVIGIFDTYDQAEVARSALVASGFACRDIELQAAPDPSSPADPALEPGVSSATYSNETGVLANIERFFSMLFGGRDRPPEVAHYSEAVRRGAVLVAIDTSNETYAELARRTLAEQGAIDIDERAASWGTLRNLPPRSASADEREHSLLDELGLGSGSGVPGRAPVNPAVDPLDAARAESIRARAYPRADIGDPAVDSLDPISPVARDPFAGSSDSSYRATGGDPMTSGSTWQEGREGELRPASESTAYSASTPAAPAADDPLTGAGVANPAEALRVHDPLSGNESTYRSPAASEPLTGGSAATGWRTVDPLDQLDETESSARVSAPRSSGSSAHVPAEPPFDTQAGSRSTVPDEYMEYEDDFRMDYETNYAATGARYEEYESAYRYGASVGSDERYRNRDWDGEVEGELQRDWQTRHPQGEDTWERFKSAVRHGWDRVTGHHHL